MRLTPTKITKSPNPIAWTCSDCGHSERMRYRRMCGCWRCFSQNIEPVYDFETFLFHRRKDAMKIRVQSGAAVPKDPRGYQVVFDRAERVSIDDPRTGETVSRLKFVWQITSGQYAGAEVDKLLSESWGPRSYLPRYLEMLYGHKLDPGVEIELDEMAGITGTVYLEENDNNFTYVNLFVRDQIKQRPQSPANSHPEPPADWQPQHQGAAQPPAQPAAAAPQSNAGTAPHQQPPHSMAPPVGSPQQQQPTGPPAGPVPPVQSGAPSPSAGQPPQQQPGNQTAAGEWIDNF